jgi:hypothetical protein
MTRIGPVFVALRTIARWIAGAARDTLPSVLKCGLALGIAVAAVVSAAQADDSKFCDDWSRKTSKLYDENYVLRCLPLSDIDPSLTGNYYRCMSIGQELADRFTKMVEDRLAECRAEAIKQKALEDPTAGPKIGDILEETKPPATSPAQPPAGNTGGGGAKAEPEGSVGKILKETQPPSEMDTLGIEQGPKIGDFLKQQNPDAH